MPRLLRERREVQSRTEDALELRGLSFDAMDLGARPRSQAAKADHGNPLPLVRTPLVTDTQVENGAGSQQTEVVPRHVFVRQHCELVGTTRTLHVSQAHAKLGSLELENFPLPLLQHLKANGLGCNRPAQGDRYREASCRPTLGASFELGVLRYNEKKYQQAEQYFQYSARNEFNIDISNFYLGLISVQMQDWNLAETRFEAVLKTEIEEIRSATHFYLAQTKFKKELPAQGFDHLIKAKKTAQK